MEKNFEQISKDYILKGSSPDLFKVEEITNVDPGHTRQFYDVSYSEAGKCIQSKTHLYNLRNHF